MIEKWYTRIIGIAFTFVLISLIMDYINFGHTAETWHKIFHVLLGILILIFLWNNSKSWKPFCIVNGLFFTFVAVFGWVWMDFGGLDAFNLVDTILHSIVGVTGIITGYFAK